MNQQTHTAAAIGLLSSGRYSACDITDALLFLRVPQAGFLPDIVPIPFRRDPSAKPLVAPVSTVLFVPISGPAPNDPQTSNIPAHQHFTDMPAPDSIALLQQPPGMISAVLGDIMATRLHFRGIRAVVANGRVRDIGPIGGFCDTKTTLSVDGTEAAFSVWSKGTSTVSPSLECKAWSADVPIKIGSVTVHPGDLLFADETERGVIVIPRENVDDLIKMLPAYKDTDDLRVADVEAGYGIVDTIQRHPDANEPQPSPKVEREIENSNLDAVDKSSSTAYF